MGTVNESKISVIIPVYNTSKYLEKCLDSLVNQTLKDIEIICIDDGSTDISLQILKEYEKNDNRFKILTQKNQGQSVARNVGLRFANGEYIGFIDSDDWADVRMFEKLYNNAKTYDSDIAMCSITVFNEKTGIYTISDSYMSLNLFNKSFENRNFNYKETLNFIFRICVVPWNKIYKREFLNSKNLMFVEGLNFEDNVFNLQTIVKAEKISLIKEPLVYYRRDSDTSYTFGKSEYKKLDFFKIFELEEKFLKEKRLFKKLEEYFWETRKNTLIYWYKKLTDKNVKEEYHKKMLVLFPDLNI